MGLINRTSNVRLQWKIDSCDLFRNVSIFGAFIALGSASATAAGERVGARARGRAPESMAGVRVARSNDKCMLINAIFPVSIPTSRPSRNTQSLISIDKIQSSAGSPSSADRMARGPHSNQHHSNDALLLCSITIFSLSRPSAPRRARERSETKKLSDYKKTRANSGAAIK